MRVGLWLLPLRGLTKNCLNQTGLLANVNFKGGRGTPLQLEMSPLDLSIMGHPI